MKNVRLWWNDWREWKNTISATARWELVPTRVLSVKWDTSKCSYRRSLDEEEASIYLASRTEMNEIRRAHLCQKLKKRSKGGSLRLRIESCSIKEAGSERRCLRTSRMTGSADKDGAQTMVWNDYRSATGAKRRFSGEKLVLKIKSMCSDRRELRNSL